MSGILFGVGFCEGKRYSGWPDPDDPQQVGDGWGTPKEKLIA